MNRTTSNAVAGVGGAVGLVAIAELAGWIPQILPPKYAGLVGLGVLVLKTVLQQIAWKRNPDGTPAQAPWIPGDTPRL